MKYFLVMFGYSLLEDWRINYFLSDIICSKYYLIIFGSSLFHDELFFERCNVQKIFFVMFGYSLLEDWNIKCILRGIICRKYSLSSNRLSIARGSRGMRKRQFPFFFPILLALITHLFGNIFSFLFRMKHMKVYFYLELNLLPKIYLDMSALRQRKDEEKLNKQGGSRQVKINLQQKIFPFISTLFGKHCLHQHNFCRPFS